MAKKRLFNPKGLTHSLENNSITDREERKRLPHGDPEASIHNKLQDPTISKRDKVENSSPSSDQIEFKGKYLSDKITPYEGDGKRLRYEVNDLWPQFEKELKDEMSKRHTTAWFKYHGAEVKIWKRFCFSYTRFYQNVAKACDFCGISRNHYYRARNLYPTLNLILDIIEDRLIDEIEETTKKHALLPNSIVERIFLLKTRRKDKYADSPALLSATKIEVNIPNIAGMRNEGDSNVKVNVQDNDRLPASTDPIEVPQVKE